MIYNHHHHSGQAKDDDQSHSKHETRENNQRIATLEKEVAELSILVEGLWNLLQSNNRLDNQNLTAAIEAVVESKKNHKEKKRGCKTCARFVSGQYKKCIYCGGDLVGEIKDSPFG